MKVNVKREEEKVEESFPMLMGSAEAGLIVLFTSETGGVVIDGGSYTCRVGEYCDNWPPCTNGKLWKKFTGTITLEND